MGNAEEAARREQLASALESVQDRVRSACAEAGRDPASVTLVVVTKFFPASDIRLLAKLGVTDVAENRDQEAGPKLSDPMLTGLGLTLHFVGQLQSNKAASVVSYADVIHAVDRIKLVTALDRAAMAAGRRPKVLIQVSLDGSAGRGGAAADLVPELAQAVSEAPAIDLAGVMAVAPLGADPDMAFATVARLARTMREQHPGATWMSAGMSGDLEAAVRQGATHLRVGSAILGSRPPLR